MNIELNINLVANANYPRQSPSPTETANYWLSQHQPLLAETQELEETDSPRREDETGEDSQSPDLQVIRGFSNLVSPTPVGTTPKDRLDVEA
jgi:hypothetical protein